MRFVRTFGRSLGIVAVLIVVLIVAPLIALSLQTVTFINISDKPIDALTVRIGEKLVFDGSLSKDQSARARFFVNDDTNYRVTARFADGTSFSEEIGYLTPLDTGRQTLEIGARKLIWDHLWVAEDGALRKTTSEEAPGAWESLEMRTKPRL